MALNGPFGSAQVAGGALGLMIAGTAGSLLAKLLYGTHAPLPDGSSAPFHKPWASTLCMFLGMTLVAPLAPLIHWGVDELHRRARAEREAAKARLRAEGGLGAPLLEPSRPDTPHSDTGSAASMEGGTSETPERRQPQTGVAVDAAAEPSGDQQGGGVRMRLLHQAGLALVPTCLDLAATILQSVGLLTISASVFQMARGSEVVFAALLSVLLLKRRLNAWHLAGIALVVAGILLVGMAAVWGGDAGNAALGSVSGGQMVVGMLLVLASEAVQAGQVVSEDYIMRGLGLRPLTVVGLEGLLGSALMLGLVLPLAAWAPGQEGKGLHEDSRATVYMLLHCRELLGMVLGYIGVVAVYNVAGMLVTDGLGAVTRTVLETTRTLLVWLLDLLLFYAAPGGKKQEWGEPWTPYSWVQALGFAGLVAGTLVYAHGDQQLERSLRAKARWARLRESLVNLLDHKAAKRPMRPSRIAGPSRIRTAFLQVLALTRLEAEVRRRRLATQGVGSRDGAEHTEPPMHPRWGSFSRHLHNVLGPRQQAAGAGVSLASSRFGSPPSRRSSTALPPPPGPLPGPSP